MLTSPNDRESIKSLSQLEYHDWRAAHSDASDPKDASSGNPEGAPYQRCLRCGRCERAGGYCTQCTSADYILEAHLHSGQGKGRHSCPLGQDGASTTFTVGFYHHVPGASLRRKLATEVAP